MDANTKVSKYLADLKNDTSRRSGSPTPINTAQLLTTRGPGQAAHDPLQFVSTSGTSLAENARQLISITEQQKRERAKLVQQGSRFDDSESWQADLDTWRRKRKTKAAKQLGVGVEPSNPARDYRPIAKDYNSLPNYGRNYKETKEEILTITSPSHQEDQNDSGIENRTTDSHSPSTSLDFSPRSDSKLTAELISPKSSSHPYQLSETSASRTEVVEQPPDYAPPPPPPLASDEKDQSLDQVLIPLNVSRSVAVTEQQKSDEDDYPPPPPRLRRPVSSDKTVEDLKSRYESTSLNIRAPPTFHYEERAATSKSFDDKSDTPSVDLTVELNREQRGQQVTAIRYPSTRTIETIPAPEATTTDNKAPSFISRLTHNVEPPPSRQYTYTSQPASPQVRRNMPPTTVYRAVDIPFDESPAAYQPKKDENLHTIMVTMGTQPIQKGLGFTITIERGRPTIDSVVVGTPADRAGLLIGDHVISVNGEDLKDKYPSAINRLLHDAARLGEAEVVVERKSAKVAQVKSYTSPENFDRARSVFNETKSVDSYAEFKRKHSRASRADQPSARDYNSLPRSTSTGNIPTKRDNSLSSIRSKASSPARSYYESSTLRSEYRSQTNGGTPDYRVTSMHEKTGPGKLTDFVPEVERAKKEEDKREFSYRRASDEEPRLIRNYDLPPAVTTTTKIAPTIKSAPLSSLRQDNDSVSAVLKRSTLPRNSHAQPEEHASDDDTVAGKSFLRKTLRSLTPPAPVGILERSPELEDSYEQQQTSHRDWRCVYPSQRSRSSYELRQSDAETSRKSDSYSYDYDRDRVAHEREEYDVDEMYRKKSSHTAGKYRDRVGVEPPKSTVVPIQRLDRGDFRYVDTPRPYQPSRSRSSDYILDRDYRDEAEISDASHRFYDRDGNYVYKDRRPDYDVDIRRDYDLTRDAERRSFRGPTTRTYRSLERRVEERRIEERMYEEKEKRMWIPERRVVESRDWREVINQQRQPAPGRAADTQRIRDASASLGNLPAIINRKLEENRKSEKERQTTTDYSYRSPNVDSYERDYERSFEKSYQPDYQNRNYDSLRYGQNDTRGLDSSYTTEYRRREQRDASPAYGRRDMSSGYREEIRREPVNNDQVVAVSGKHRCAHCGEELGRGAAMIIESLNLFYHLACFKCYVCKTPLGSGATGADVRVREGRLHCQSCYSNDRLQLSKV
ncbi:unnamed protein product [Cylicocyclus nassatus]|uniref:Uncharacterized protein n=1 Tax=Cylicocyclus nassatus TaxID=53992 RepID=A0AA36GY27_CYLNA|nr:unnamed protein product [Cylicocyclus nassatus]